MGKLDSLGASEAKNHNLRHQALCKASFRAIRGNIGRSKNPTISELLEPYSHEIGAYLPFEGGLLPRPPPDGFPVRLGQFGLAGADGSCPRCSAVMAISSDVARLKHSQPRSRPPISIRETHAKT